MKQFLANVTGMDGYLIFSMVLFFLFFVGLIWWVYKADQSYINEMEKLPFDQEPVSEDTHLTQ
jgi:cytochrome c oxidase cbb3-type subunit IV